MLTSRFISKRHLESPVTLLMQDRCSYEEFKSCQAEKNSLKQWWQLKTDFTTSTCVQKYCLLFPLLPQLQHDLLNSQIFKTASFVTKFRLSSPSDEKAARCLPVCSAERPFLLRSMALTSQRLNRWTHGQTFAERAPDQRAVWVNCNCTGQRL